MRFLAAALLVHAAAAAPLVMSAARSTSSPTSLVIDDPAVFDVMSPDLLEPTLAPAAIAMATETTTKTKLAALAPNGAKATASDRLGDSTKAAHAPPAAATSSEPEPSSSGWTPGIALPKRVDIGLGGGIAYKASDAPADAAPRAAPNSGGVREALDARDRSLGLGSGGAIVGVARGVAMSAPMQEGAALLEIDADAAGAVRTCRVADVSADARAWNDIANGICASLKGRPLPVPSGVRGVVVALRIEIAMRLPSGARAGHGVTPGVGPGTVGIEFDLADLGAQPKKAVHARIVGERRL